MVPRSTQLPQRYGASRSRKPAPGVEPVWSAGCDRARHWGPDTGYDTGDFITAFCGGVTPHIAQNTPPAQRHRTTRHPGYAVSQQKRKLVEEIFGWLKTVPCCGRHDIGGMRRVGWMFTFAAAVYNLVRIRNLSGADART
jgi:hypothetical protein